MLDLKFYQVKRDVGKSRMPISRTAGIFGDWGDIWLSIKRAYEKTYGIGNKEEPLLNAEQLAGNSSGSGMYLWWIVSNKGLSPGRRFLFAGASSVHNVGNIPP
jgi:hypothetical protein